MPNKNKFTQTFLWKGTNAHGKKIKGEINAPSLAVSKVMLRQQGIQPRSVRKKINLPFLTRTKKITTKDITDFTRQMATMLNSGIALVQTFAFIRQGLNHSTLHTLITQLQNDVAQGHTFSEALSKHPRHFNALYCSLVAVGEQAGLLDNLLDRLATYKEKNESLKSKLKKALFYPIAVLCIALGVTAALLVFVVPQFQALFAGFNASLPYFTQCVIDLSHFICTYGWILAGLSLALVWIFMYALKKSTAFPNTIDRVLLKLFIVGNILQKAAIARFARTLAISFAAGVPLVEALPLVAKATGNNSFQQAIQQIGREITKGVQLQFAMRMSGLFPPMVLQMIAIGEEAGSIEKMLTKVADFYEEEVTNSVDSLSSLLEPCLVTLLGLLVGGLVMAMYLPIFKLGSIV